MRHDGRVSADRQLRKQLGAWYTPMELVDHVLDHVLDPLLREAAPGTTVSVLDPACGDGRFLAAARNRIERSGRVARLTGVDVDPLAGRAARAALGPAAEVVKSDALTRRWGGRRFDVVLGNPPFLTPLSSAHGVRMTGRAGGPYADAAAEFLALATRLARSDGGRIGLVVPLSIISTRDAAPVRAEIEHRGRIDWFWFAPRPVFDAEVRTGALGIVLGGDRAPVRRTHGKRFVERSPIDPPATDVGADLTTWSWLVSDQLGVPPLPTIVTRGTVGELAACGGDFRDEYYGLVGAVEEAGGGTPTGPPLVTSGLIDAGVCHWGERETRFAKAVYGRPVVRVERLAGPMAAWARQRLVPKVLVASQTRVIEAVADPAGAWLPGVPVVSVTPRDPADVWHLAAALTGPVASAWLAQRAGGSGLSAHSLRISAPVLAELPLPAGSLDEAIAELRAGRVGACAVAVTAAYGVTGPAAAELLEWWFSASRVPRPTPRRVRR